jgi:hypothetical protein
MRSHRLSVSEISTSRRKELGVLPGALVVALPTSKVEETAMIAYHGGPFSAPTIAAEVWRKHHAMISFARNEQIGIAAEHASSFALDNGPSRCGEQVSTALTRTRTIAG